MGHIHGALSFTD